MTVTIVDINVIYAIKVDDSKLGISGKGVGARLTRRMSKLNVQAEFGERSLPEELIRPILKIV